MPQDIRQIIPANGWVAVYIQDTPPNRATTSFMLARS
jgi:hypothetical protein